MTTVTIYATPACHRCKQLAGTYRSAGVDFKYLIVGEDITKEELEHLVGRVVRSVPVVVDHKGVEINHDVPVLLSDDLQL